MFNIRKDDEILVAVQTHGFAISPDDAAAAKVTGQHAIDFEHPLVCWNDLKSAWNEELAEVFADRVLEEYSEFSRDNVKTQFHERLKALKKSMKKGVEKPGAPSPVDRKVTDMKADRRRSRKKKVIVGFDRRFPHSLMLLFRSSSIGLLLLLSTLEAQSRMPGSFSIKCWRHSNRVA